VGYSGELLALGVLQAAMPSSVMGSVLCEESHMAGEYAVSVVFATTILSAVTMPLLLAVLR
jgi:predicted permease